MEWSRSKTERSYTCNELLAQFRKKRGWAQAELARQAGYSERLVRKAESGQPVSPDTIADLAEALSLPDDPLYPEDLVGDVIHLAKSFVAAWYVDQSNAVSSIRHFLHEEMEFELVGDVSKGIPFAGTYRGPDELAKFFEQFFTYCQVPDRFDHTPFYSYHAVENTVSVVGTPSTLSRLLS